MIGAIIGDIAGSRFEFNNTKSPDFDFFADDCHFTDDTVCSVAIASALLHHTDYAKSLVGWCTQYIDAGYGGMFLKWLSDQVPTNSYGNGAVMRISPIPLLLKDLETVKEQTYLATVVSHNHPDAIKYATAVSSCIFNLKSAMPKQDAIKDALDYIGMVGLPQFYPYKNPFRSTVYNCVPAALYCLNEGVDFESTIRIAISLGGDVDTIAACAGGMAEALYGVPEKLFKTALTYLTPDMRDVVRLFYQTLHGETAPLQVITHI